MKKFYISILTCLSILSINSAFASAPTVTIINGGTDIQLTGDTTHWIMYYANDNNLPEQMGTLPATIDTSQGDGVYEFMGVNGTDCDTLNPQQCEAFLGTYSASFGKIDNGNWIQTGGVQLSTFVTSPSSLTMAQSLDIGPFWDPYNTPNQFTFDPTDTYNIGNNTNTLIVVMPVQNTGTGPAFFANGGIFPIQMNTTDYTPVVGTYVALAVPIPEAIYCTEFSSNLEACKALVTSYRISNTFSITPNGTSSSSSIDDMIANSSSTFMATTGFSPAQGISNVGSMFIMPIIGGGIMMLQALLPWIIVLIVLSAFVYFAYRAFRFYSRKARSGVQNMKREGYFGKRTQEITNIRDDVKARGKLINIYRNKDFGGTGYSYVYRKGSRVTTVEKDGEGKITEHVRYKF